MRTHTVTLFNKGEKHYRKTILDGVHIEVARSVRTNADGGYNSTSRARLFIWDLQNYVNAVDYEKLSWQQRKGVWTVKENDIIVKGIVEEVDNIRLETLKQNYNSVYRVVEVYDRDFGSKSMQHLEVNIV